MSLRNIDLKGFFLCVFWNCIGYKKSPNATFGDLFSISPSRIKFRNKKISGEIFYHI